MITSNRSAVRWLGGRLFTELRATKSLRVRPERQPRDGLVRGTEPKSMLASLEPAEQEKGNEMEMRIDEWLLVASLVHVLHGFLWENMP